MEEAEVKPRVRGRNRGLVAILVVLVLAIVGLSVGIVVVNLINKKAREAELENLSRLVLDLTSNNESVVDTVDVQKRLENILEKSKDQDELIRATGLLSLLYADEEKSVEAYEDLLEYNLDDLHRYDVLKALLFKYREQNQKDKIKSTLEELVALPDDMVLEHEDWSSIKPVLENELDYLKSENSDAS